MDGMQTWQKSRLKLMQSTVNFVILFPMHTFARSTKQRFDAKEVFYTLCEYVTYIHSGEPSDVQTDSPLFKNNKITLNTIEEINTKKS